ncbi:hypothetical protein BT96DRAFT_978242 [Gymnopus androsaceus JB14]|uniref:Uncharacterized protein n=1 Tax=Gymnopus androsaceus JB14 TaxID=1447944 RepID=A0A6A4H9N3_9AGAR|nr:hypothetical protein BT96DRAFT_978242 [Gymnopus androsaceus JB14]
MKTSIPDNNGGEQHQNREYQGLVKLGWNGDQVSSGWISAAVLTVKSGEDDDEAGIIDSMTQLELALVWSLGRQRTWVRTADVTTNNNTSMKCDGATMYLISVRQAEKLKSMPQELRSTPPELKSMPPELKSTPLELKSTLPKAQEYAGEAQEYAGKWTGNGRIEIPRFNPKDLERKERVDQEIAAKMVVNKFA